MNELYRLEADENPLTADELTTLRSMLARIQGQACRLYGEAAGRPRSAVALELSRLMSYLRQGRQAMDAAALQERLSGVPDSRAPVRAELAAIRGYLDRTGWIQVDNAGLVDTLWTHRELEDGCLPMVGIPDMGPIRIVQFIIDRIAKAEGRSSDAVMLDVIAGDEQRGDAEPGVPVQDLFPASDDRKRWSGGAPRAPRPDDTERIRRALSVCWRYGTIDGDHHKMWVIDQVVRALLGSPIKIEAGQGYLYEAQAENTDYDMWLRGCEADDAPWERGIAP
jgi:hypothetical protein